jgi:two-component system phosphate regulon sensor histidine kinase PhoR
MNRSYLFIAISSFALLAVLIIQINWILETAKIKEELFNEKANMVLTRTTEALSSDVQACREIGSNEQASGSIVINARRNTEICISNNEIQKIDSLFKHFMNFYNFHIDYSFVVIKPIPFKLRNENGLKNNVYNKRLDEVASKNGVELVLIFPEKRQFIMAEMGTLFITSVLLILVVLVLFWRTVLSLAKKKKILEHTTEFLNNMTHEFKTPLTNIALAGRMLLKKTLVSEEDTLKHYSGIILEENEKLKLQVEQMLSITALERGEIPMHTTGFDFHQVIGEVLKNISVQIENKEGQLKLELMADRFIVLGDKMHLTNAFRNLVDNALKYSGEHPVLTVRTRNADHRLIVVVSDNGIGIEGKNHRKVFDKFFRVSTGNVHDVKGFGLGLAYTKKVVEMHHGTIGLESEKGKGSTFTISLQYV